MPEDRSESPKVEEVAAPIDPVVEWERKVRERFRFRCGNCGGSDRLKVRMAVPEEAGGKLVSSNGLLLCRPCEMAAETRGRSDEDRRPINFWVSRSLYDRLQNGLRTRAKFPSIGALIRYLMGKYVEDESRFDDLPQYIEEGSDVKVNCWVDRGTYASFKERLDARGMTVTDAVKALIVCFETLSEQREEAAG